MQETSPEPNPLILTLSLENEASEYFTALRNQYFPPHRNYLKAHLTLFHKLPPQEERIEADLLELSQKQQQLPLHVSGLISLGRGVAFKIESPELQQIHRVLQLQWEPFLSPQDKQKLRPHITIQNKVDPEIARELKEKLEQGFTSFTIAGTGFSLWEYAGAPWKFIREFPFSNRS
ncbi:2'-5' RNA ligase family protein [Sabulibacter ruber]|uniref:2'-5' RNA ligase family protein n=1 Tax=Sabulibacter ruber TaxID=2811901 RepID=UPI001A971BD1|nr:2'-5' RNA ligase family protein [Sabulibacter ruber]